MKQDQFLTVLSRDEAEAKLHDLVDISPLNEEEVPLEQALGRILSRDVVASIDVPAFHRSNVDGFAVVANDTYLADEEEPIRLRLNKESIAAGDAPTLEVKLGTSTPIATGAVIPRGASAVVMVEFTDSGDDEVLIYRPAGPGDGMSYAGSDIMQGETVLRTGDLLSSRETGTLAALGIAACHCVWKPRVAILSTGNEIIDPGEKISEGKIYDSNSRIVADTVRENGGEDVFLGIVPDDEEQLEAAIRDGLRHDMLILSGGTSKGGGDLNYRVIERLGTIHVHGVALKPGKPLCIAIVDSKPVIILPGFPTSAIVTFRDFVQPIIRSWAGLPPQSRRVVTAQQAIRYHSDKGRMEYTMVNLVKSDDGYRTYPWTKGSGAVTTFSQADGFIKIPANQEMVLENQNIEVELIGEELSVPDITSIGSHCVGLDFLLSEVKRFGFGVKIINVGSMGGLEAARRGESDLSGIHLMDEKTGVYNESFAADDDNLVLVRGYVRRQGILARPGHFERLSLDDLLSSHANSGSLNMVNRIRGSGTRILTDKLLTAASDRLGISFQKAVESIRGYEIEARSHNAVAVSIATNKADWGIGIETVARDYGLQFEFLEDEHYDFVMPCSKFASPAIQRFLEFLQSEQAAKRLNTLGFQVPEEMGKTLDLSRRHK